MKPPKSLMRVIFPSCICGLIFCLRAPVVAADAPAPDLNKLVAALSAKDPETRDKAEGDIDRASETDLAGLEKILAAGGLPEDATRRLKLIIDGTRRRNDKDEQGWKANEIEFPYYTKQAIVDYGRDGHTSPKWDDAAREGLAAGWERGTIRDLAANKAKNKEAVEQLQIAMTAGCDDPGVLVTAALVGRDNGASPQQVIDLIKRAAVSEKGTSLSPYFRMVIDNRLIRWAAESSRNPDARDESIDPAALLDDMCANSVKLTQSPDVPVIVALDMANITLEDADFAHGDKKIVFDAVYPPLEARAPNDSNVWCMKGKFYVDYAWLARGGAAAANVAPEKLTAFADRLAVAQGALEKAYDLDHQSADAASQMIRVVIGLGKSRDEMETWFKRAMDADPDNYIACDQKLNYLKPQWYGSAEEMLAFGHECFDGGNFHAGLPYILVRAHEQLARLSRAPGDYYKKSSVWADIDSYYSGVLARYPGENAKRSAYAKYACMCQKWAVANEQFETLGDKVDVAAFGNAATLKRYKAKAAAMSNQPAINRERRGCRL